VNDLWREQRGPSRQVRCPGPSPPLPLRRSLSERAESDYGSLAAGQWTGVASGNMDYRKFIEGLLEWLSKIRRLREWQRVLPLFSKSIRLLSFHGANDKASLQFG
jgi:hypothetical protein